MRLLGPTILHSLALIAGFFLLFIIGKTLHGLIHRSYKANFELFQNDNPALALAMTGYYLGLVLAIGGALAGPSHGLARDLMDLGV